MLYVITNREIAINEGRYYNNIQRCLMNNVEALVIREKNLSKDELDGLCRKINELRGDSKTKIIMNCNKDINMAYALKYKFHGIQMSYNDFINSCTKEDKNQLCTCDMNIITGVSVHSAEEAICALENRAHYVTIGHIFKTKCKEGLEPRGIDVIKEIRSQNEKGHIVAIGGIDENNAMDVIQGGADSFAMMSKIMCSEDIDEFLHKLKHKIDVIL